MAALSMGFSRQENWRGLPFPSPGDLPNPRIEPRSPALQADALTSESPGKPEFKPAVANWTYAQGSGPCSGTLIWASQVVLVVKNLPAIARDLRDAGSVPWFGISPGGRHGNPLQYSCLENPHGQRSLAKLQSMGLQRADTTEGLSTAQLFILRPIPT